MRNLLLSTVTLLVVPAVAIATPDFPSHTHTTPIELEPISPSSGLKLASVCFLGYGDCGDAGFDSIGGDGDYNLDTAKQCLNEGYIKNNCNAVQTPVAYCPYNKSYISGCKCISNLISCSAGQVGVGDSCGGKYASCKCDPNLISCPSNKIGSGASCGGKYQSCVCKSEYQYTSSNCTSPRSVSGSSCDGKYTGCSCPRGIDEGNFGCKEYYPSPCSSVCKIAYTDNCHNRTDRNSQTYGCMKYYDDCPTKCETPYKDNCRNRTAVTIPENASCSSYFSDCSSKCSAWNCISGYELKDGVCKQLCDNRFVYDSSNCTGNMVLGGESCGGKYERCESACSGQYQYPYSTNYVAYGKICDDKHDKVWNFKAYGFYNKFHSCSSCTAMPASFSYLGKNAGTTFYYFTPTKAQTSSKETVVTSCGQLLEALANPDVFNIRISGKLVCPNTETGGLSTDKHIYGSNKNSDGIELTDKEGAIYANNLKLSNLTITRTNKLTYPIIFSDSLAIENVNFRVSSGILNNTSLIFTGGENTLYVENSGGCSYESSNIIVVGPNAVVNIVNNSSCYNAAYYESIYVLGKINGTHPENSLGLSPYAHNGVYFVGNGGSFSGLYNVNSGGFIYAPETGASICIAADNSNVQVNNSWCDSAAVGNNATMMTQSVSNLWLAMGKNAKYNGISNSKLDKYSYFTTDNLSVFY